MTAYVSCEGLLRQVVDQSIRILNVAPGKPGLVFDNLTTFFQQVGFSALDIRNRNFQYWYS